MWKQLLIAGIVLGAFGVASPAHAQDDEAKANAEADATVQPETPAHPEANPADVESIDAIIAALYDVISGPAGERDWDRFRSLFAPGAVLSAMVPRPDGSHPARVFTYEDYVRFGGAYFMENAFFERETGPSHWSPMAIGGTWCRSLGMKYATRTRCRIGSRRRRRIEHVRH
jgi:hypothetical protein